MPDSTVIPTLYEWSGGIERLRQLTEAFYRKVTNDALLGPVDYLSLEQSSMSTPSSSRTKAIVGPHGRFSGGATEVQPASIARW
jgi:hypothetical protein